MSQKSAIDLTPPEEFGKIINDFTADILITFPEYSGIIGRWWNRRTDNVEESEKKETLFVFRHCVGKFPERFFDILYKNDEIFKENSEVNTEFLPGIVFTQLWNLDISESTKDTLWKYLQLILFAVIGTVPTSSHLGDTAKLFEAIDEEELKKKLEETLEGMQHMFENKQAGAQAEAEAETEANAKNNMFSAEQLHEHIQSMMGGKLGKLALELAEDTAKDLNLDMENQGDAKDVFQKLFKNPGKMMNMVKNIGNKIDDKLKSGEIKESELMEEGMDLLNKMKNMPGMENMQQMFAQMGVPGLGKGAKLNMGAMEAQMNRNMKTAKMKERMRSNVEARAKATATATATATAVATANSKPQISDEELVKIFSTGEKVEKTPRGAVPPPSASSQNNNNKPKKKNHRKN
jgi:hypothetical protein